MSGAQLDLFSGDGFRVERPPPDPKRRPGLVPTDLDGAALIAALTRASLADCRGLADEAGRRRLVAAVPALETLCRRFKGFGLDHTVPEQTAALAGLSAIGGGEAAAAVARIVADRVIQGPGLTGAIRTAADLRSRLPAQIVLPLLRHGDPGIREEACRCAHAGPEVIAVLVDLLDDLNRAVARAAACALGRMGRIEARPVLVRLLQEDPSMEVIDAAVSVDDAACIVLLGRIARTRPDLASAALGALGDSDDPRAAAITAALTAAR